jgi:predicted PurR-regulated permease PerM
MVNRKIQAYFFIILITVSAILSLAVFQSYLTLLAFGGILAVVVNPIYKYIHGKIKSESFAAFLTVICSTLVVVLPTVYFLTSLTTELIGVLSDFKAYFDATTFQQVLIKWIPVSLHEQIPTIIDGTKKVLNSIAGQLSNSLVGFFSDLFNVLLSFVVVMIAAYYLLKDGSKIRKEVLAISPLGDEYDEIVIEKVIVAVSAVVNGVLIVAFIKGILASIFFWIFGIPAPLFWGTMTGFSALVPMVGSGLVTLPAVLYLFAIGKVGAAIGLTIVSIFLISTIDNFLQPKLVESKTKIHPLLILLSILGGLQFYGFAGFILGPLTLAVTIALLDISKKEFKKYLNG